MKLISHRGNIDGKTFEENNPRYILAARDAGYDVEIDVWCIDERYYLGHDEPQYEVDLDFLKMNGFWCHAKNIEALYKMTSEGVHCFWHQEDDVTLTSNGFLWTYPNKDLTPNSICVLPEVQEDFFASVYIEFAGICSDYISKYKTLEGV